MTPDDLRAIAARSMTLDERIDCCGNAQQRERSPDDPATVRLERWRRLFADDAAFASRLTHAGIVSDALPMILGSETRHRQECLGHTELPAWAKLLDEALGRAAAASHRGDRLYCSTAAPLPFEEVLAPFVDAATEELRGRTAGACVVAPAAEAMLQRALLALLANIAVRPLMLEFSIFRALNQPIGGKTDGTALYEEFIRRTIHDLPRFFAEYSALGRILSIGAQQWIDNAAACLLRLSADRRAVAAFFGAPDELPAVVAARTMLSDPHAGGRTVMALRLAAGPDLIYKPREVKQEMAFNDLLLWLNGRGAPVTMKTVRILPRDGYGWQERIEPSPAGDEAARRSFFERAGALAAVLYLVGATDCHYQNVIACGDAPVIVDMETMLSGSSRGYSLLDTDFVPRSERGPHGSSYDLSGMGGRGGQPLPMRVAQWSNVNSDRMDLSFDHLKTPDEANLAGDDASAYADEIVGGFTAMYGFLRDRREELLAGPLAAMASLQRREVPKVSRLYHDLLNRSLAPELLREGIDRSLHFEVLSASAGSLTRAGEERRALENLDVPLFTASSTDGFEAMTARIQSLGSRDLDRQLAILRESLQAETPFTSLLSHRERVARPSA